MRYRIIKMLICVACLLPTMSFGQKSVLDSIRQELKKPLADSSRAYLLMMLANRSAPADSTVPMILAEALRLASKSKNSILVARIYIATGGWHFDNQRYDKSTINYQQALQVLKDDNSRRAIVLKAQVMMNEAGLSYRQGHPNEAIEIYFQAIPKLESISDTFTLATAYEHLGSLFFNQSEYTKSAIYFGKSIALDGNAPRSSLDVASKYLSMAFCMLYLDSVAVTTQYLQQAKLKLESVGDPVADWGKYYYLLGRIQSHSKQYQVALQSYQKAHSVAKRFNDLYTTGDILEAETYLYKDMGRYSEALATVKKLKVLSTKVPEVSFSLDALKLLAELEFKMQHPTNAYLYLEEYIEQTDSLQRDKVSQRIHELETQYQSAQKESKIVQLQRENDRKAFTLKRNRLSLWLLAITAGALLVIALLVYLFYRRGRTFLRQEKLLHQFEMDKVNQQHRIAVLSAMLEGQELERTRLARDLHDGLGGLLSGVKIELSASAAPRDVLVTQTAQRLDTAVDELRRIAKSMMPEVLLAYGLGEATREYCNALKKTGIPVSCQVYRYKNDMNPGRQVTLYRIMQELVNNAIKHAAATKILVQLQQSDGNIYLTVEDDGRGLDTRTIEAVKGVGLSNIRARVEILQGKMEVHSVPGVGTTFNIECTV